MFLAVVHAGGSDRARELIARWYPGVDPSPTAITTAGGGAIVGSQGAGPLIVKDGYAIEGTLDAGEFAPESGSGRAAASYLAGLRGDFALGAVTDDGLVVTSGPGGGHRPVFVVVQREWAAASTRMRALLGLLDSRPPLDVDFLAAASIIDYPTERAATPFVGLHHVPLGEAWALRPGGCRQLALSAVDPPRTELRGNERDHARGLREVLDRAIVRAVRGASKVGVTASGGLDSSSVLLALNGLRRAGEAPSQLEAFAWEFDTPDAADDRPYRRAVERALGSRVTRIDPEEAAPFARRALVLDAMPCTDVPCPLWLALDQSARRHGVDRVMTGLGGDNVLDGNGALFSELARKGRPIEAVVRAARLRGVGRSSPWWRVDHFVLRPWLQALAPEPVRALRRRAGDWRWFDWMGPRYRPWLRARENASAGARPVVLDSSPAERYEALARMPFLADAALLRAQHEEVARCRRVDPLFDDELLRYVATLPPMSLFAGNYRRGLLREAVRDLLPDAVATRSDKAYMEPALARLVVAAGGFAPLSGLARVARLADLGLVEPRKFRGHFDRLARAPGKPYWWSVWPALAVEEFLRQYDEGWVS